MTESNSLYKGLVQHESDESFDIQQVQSFCKKTNEPIVATYDLNQNLSKSILTNRPFNMWRYKELLPVFNEEKIVTLGEGFTPILPLHVLAAKYACPSLVMKEEGYNPTGSFKARGLGMAVSKANELGIKEFAIPTAGNAGSALSAYCAKAGLKAHIYMPEKTPDLFQMDCRIMGARVVKVSGSIADAGAAMRADNAEGQWFDVTTLKEPFRLEGKKTMGLEIAEQLNWKLPNVIIYPTGGGTGLIGIWKAFQELKQLGWIDEIPTRMVAVQTSGCDPIVQAWEKGNKSSLPYENPAETMANGLRVPHAFGHKLILKTLYDSNGCAVRVNESEILIALKEFATSEGLYLSPEGAAVWHAFTQLRNKNWITDADKVLIINTGSGYKYAENVIEAMR